MYVFHVNSVCRFEPATQEGNRVAATHRYYVTHEVGNRVAYALGDRGNPLVVKGDFYQGHGRDYDVARLIRWSGYVPTVDEWETVEVIEGERGEGAFTVNLISHIECEERDLTTSLYGD